MPTTTLATALRALARRAAFVLCALALAVAAVPGRAAAEDAPTADLPLRLATVHAPLDPRRTPQATLDLLSPIAFATLDPARLQAELPATRSRGDRAVLVRHLQVLGTVLLGRGDLAGAQRHLDEALAESRRLDDLEARAVVLQNLGAVQAQQGRYAEALASTQEALAVFRQAAGAPGLPSDPTRLPAARDHAQAGVYFVLMNVAALHAQLGQFAEAFRRLDELEATDSRAVLSMRAAIAQRAGRVAEARDAARRAAQAPDDADNAYTLARSVPLRPPADTPVAAAPRVEANAAPPAAAMPSYRIELLLAAAEQAEQAGRAGDAFAAWSSLTLLAEQRGAADALRRALAGRQRAAQALGRRELAIYAGKRAVEEIQRRRADLRGLDRDARRAFGAASRAVFEALADALLDAGRLPEAERALVLLRQDDVADLVHGEGSMPLTAAEAALRERELALLGRLQAVERRRAAAGSALRPDALSLRPYESSVDYMAGRPPVLLEEIGKIEAELWPRPGVPRPEEPMGGLGAFELLREVTRLADCPDLPVDARLEAARSQARRLLERARREGTEVPFPATAAPGAARVQRAPTADLPRCLDRADEALVQQAGAVDPALEARLAERGDAFTPAQQAELDAGRAALARAADGSVALHLLVEARRVRILRVAEPGWRLHDLAVPRATLEAAAVRLLDTLQSDRRDPVPAAQALHAMLLAPIDADLRALDAKTLLVATDGRLRQLPFAALHDGRGWLVERFAVVAGAATSDARPPRAPGPLRVAAFGASGGGAGFDALPAVPAELAAVVRGASGTSWLDRAFTARALREALAQGYPVVHLASHFALRDDDAGASFLLLGDGTRLTLRELGSDGYPLGGVHLVTLSACRTALDVRDAYGQAFEGLAAVLRARGAASVLSTLWPVSDASTARLMGDFYAERVHAGKAAALRRAQLAMIGGGAGDASAERGASRPPDAPGAAQARTWSHPYFWAPFVLAGDWR